MGHHIYFQTPLSFWVVERLGPSDEETELSDVIIDLSLSSGSTHGVNSEQVRKTLGPDEPPTISVGWCVLISCCWAHGPIPLHQQLAPQPVKEASVVTTSLQWGKGAHNAAGRMRTKWREPDFSLIVFNLISKPNIEQCVVYQSNATWTYQQH